MAESVAVHGELGVWRGEDVGLGQVLDALSGLRRGEQRTATRASVTNLVQVAAGEDEVARACTAVHRLGRRHPGRSIALLPRPRAEPSGIDAEVILHGSVHEGHPVWSEDIRLVVRGEPASHLDSLVKPLTLADVPVAVWWVTGLPDPADPLLRAAGAVIVDCATLDESQVGAVAALARRFVVLDLCWAGLRPWRQVLAGQFEVPAARPFVAGVRAVEVSGPTWPALLLAGWATSRLGLPPGAVRRSPGLTPAIHLSAQAGGRTATFSAEQMPGPGGSAIVRAWSTLAADGARDDRLTLPGDPLAWALGEALTHLGRDRTHGQALAAAVGFAG
ncbi:MAG TPA: glucose-6-phosphate dehydrogenase assembly protein OpcA [Acidimicrobiales bacterium]|nr:glucose-6-phosphate dehydrogenase assembly protein OpcA [Acidimicrobiales bacterium]